MTRRWNKHLRGFLMGRTMVLLRETKMTALQIYDETGISPDWQARFLSGKIADPGVNRVECLFVLLAGFGLEQAILHYMNNPPE